MKPQTIIFIGPQGSGKGTQVDLLESWLTKQLSDPVVVFQTGQPFRDLAAKGGYAAELVRNRIDKGYMIPNAVTNALVVNNMMSRIEATTNIILDGYPRDVLQAQNLDEALQFFERDVLTVVHLDTPDEVVKARMVSRGRNDDVESAITERLRLYHSVTKPLVDYYQARPGTKCIHVDGAASIEKVASLIQSKVLETLT